MKFAAKAKLWENGAVGIKFSDGSFCTASAGEVEHHGSAESWIADMLLLVWFNVQHLVEER